MKVLGIVGSPRRNGNTAHLVETVLDGARTRGAETEIFHLGDLKVNPCRACYSCDRTGRCIQEDDMQLIYDSLKDTNTIVFGTPIYYGQVCALAKIFIDRLSAYDSKMGSKFFPESFKDAVVVITYALNNPNGYDSILEWIKQTFKRGYHYFSVETVATLKAYGTKREPVPRPDLLREAKAIGENLASA